MSQPSVPQVGLRTSTVAILLAGMLVTAAVRGFLAMGSWTAIAPVFGMSNIEALWSLPEGWNLLIWGIDWFLTACGVIVSALVVLPSALRPARRRRTARVLPWLMAADAVVYLVSFAIVRDWQPSTWDAAAWWLATGIVIGTLCTFWTAVVVFRRTAPHRAA